MNQSEFQAISCNLHAQSAEKLRVQNAIGQFGFYSHWLKKSFKYQPLSIQVACNCLNTFDSYLKTACSKNLIITSPVWRISVRDIGP